MDTQTQNNQAKEPSVQEPIQQPSHPSVQKTKKVKWNARFVWQLVTLGLLMATCAYMTYATKYLLLVAVAILGACIVALGVKKKYGEVACRVAKTTVVVVSMLVLLIAIFEITEWDKYLQDGDRLRQIIGQTFWLGLFIYFCLCLLQVVILPIPSVVLVLIGTNLFGATPAFLVTTLATILGSMIAFWMGRRLGKKFVVWLVGKKAYDKCNRIIKQKGKYYLALMFLLPIFPDDILCMVAGISSIAFLDFLLICVATRPVMIAFTCYLGTGDIIPFAGWGIPIWIGIFAIFTVIFVFGQKIGKKFENKKRISH